MKLPNARLHAAIHVIVENQIAIGDELPVRRVLDRLQSEGLDRHEAIHPIGSALAGHMGDLLNTGTRKGDSNEAYWTELGRLTAEGGDVRANNRTNPSAVRPTAARRPRSPAAGYAERWATGT